MSGVSVSVMVWAALAAVSLDGSGGSAAVAPGPGWFGLTPLTSGWLTFAFWLAGSLALGWITGLLWRRVLLPLARRPGARLNEIVLRRLRRPVAFSVMLGCLKLGARSSFQNIPAVAEHTVWQFFLGSLYVALVAALSFVVHAVLSAGLDWYRERIRVQEGAGAIAPFVNVLQKVAKFVLFFIGLTIVLDHWGIKVTGLLATAGVASLAVAFAAQETLSNTISGFILLIDRPFRPGDRVELANGKTGDVIEVGLRTTRILSFDNTVINIPNADIAKNQIVNIGAPDARFKIRAEVGVAYSTDVRRAMGLLLDVMRAHPEVLKEPEPSVFFKAFGESSLDLLFICWVADYHDQFRIRSELNLAIKDRFEAAGVEIPFPQRDIHIVSGGAATPASGTGDRGTHAPGG